MITYLLAIGDRHLDNILLTDTGPYTLLNSAIPINDFIPGKILHIDFGYLFGRDPKPFSPLIKISQEMVDALGGMSSGHFERFEVFTCAKYVTLRKYAKVIISSISLVAASNLFGNIIDMESILQVRYK